MARENRFFLLSSELTGCVPVTVDGRPVGALYGEFTARLESLCGREAAELFAEPMLPRSAASASAAVSWYGPAEGRPVELDGVDTVARKPIADRLRERLDSLAPAFADSELAPLVLAALNVASSRDIVAAGGEPILVNWGYLPQDAAQDSTRRLEHFKATLGRYAPRLIPSVAQALGPAPEKPVFAGPELAAAPINPTAAQASPIVAAPTPAVKSPTALELATVGETVPAWRAPLVAAAIAAALLLILLLPGVLAYPDFGDRTARDDYEARRLRGSNDSLEAQIRALRKVTGEGVCRVENSVTVPEMADASKPPPKMDLLPRPPDRAALPIKPGEPPQAPTVAQLLEKSVVSVFALLKDDKVGAGSGFFISPTQVVTNRHVIEDALDEQYVFVASKSLNGVLRARVIAKTPPRQQDDSQPDFAGDDTQPDFAVLELSGPADVAPLKLGPAPAKLSTVYIAGYPGFPVAADSDRETFIKDLKAAQQGGEIDRQLAGRRFDMPSLDLRYGRVNNVMSSGARETPIVVHDMQAAHANSGGPLMDSCGHVAGVNTSPSADEHSLGNVALSVVALQQFLAGSHIAFTIDDAPCGPTTEAGPIPQPILAPAPSQN